MPEVKKVKESVIYLRVDPELHAKIKLLAQLSNKSITNYVLDLCQEKILETERLASNA